jgi:hypothetical protein
VAPQSQAFARPGRTTGQEARSVDTHAPETQPLVPGHVLALVGVFTVVGFLVRLPAFRSSLFGDELSTYYIVAGHSLSRVLRLVESNQETSPPLYFVVAWATRGILHNQGESIRLVSLVTGTAMIPLTFLVGLMSVGRRAALVAAALVALSPSLILYSSEARPFMLAAFFALLSTLSMLRALDSGKTGWWVAYACFTSATAYTHYTAVFLLVLQLAWALWSQPRARKPLVVTNIAAALTYLPWLNGLREDLHAPNYISAIAPFDAHTVETILESVWIVSGPLTVALVVAGLLIGGYGLARRVKDGTVRLRWQPSSRVFLLVLLGLGPTVLIILYSAIRADIFATPFLIYSWPAWALLIGALVCVPPRPLWTLAVGLTVAAYAVGAIRTLGQQAQRPDIDATVSYIAHAGQPNDPIVCQCLSDGPLSELDVALADAGLSQERPVLRLGAPSQAETVRPLSGPNPQPGLFYPSPPSAQVVADQAAALAHGGTIFLVTHTLYGDLRAAYAALSPASQVVAERRQFLAALPAPYRVTDRRSYTGSSGGLVETVYTISASGVHP